MRIILDSGVYVTALLCPESDEAKAIIKASEGLHKIVLSESIRDEVYAIFREYLPEKVAVAETFFAELTAIDAPENVAPHDVFVTSDTEFLESVIDFPKMMTAREFLGYR
jgi:predicted nucleic acid-binding protein